MGALFQTRNFVLTVLIFMLTISNTNAQINNLKSHPWRLEYKDGCQSVVIKETGEMVLTRYDKALLPGAGKSMLDRVDTTDLFALATNPEFEHSKEAYSPPKFDRHGCYMSITLVDAKDLIVHKVKFSNESENLPKTIKELQMKIVKSINKLFGPPLTIQ